MQSADLSPIKLEWDELEQNLLNKIALGFNLGFQMTLEFSVSLTVSFFKSVNASIIQAFSSSLVWHGVLLISHSTSPYI